MNTQESAQERLLKFGIKPSLQRMAIMEYLMKYSIHPTADVIFNNLYKDIPTLSKTTVYNTLKLLEEQGAILAINIDEKNVHYDADISFHAHFRCKKCGQIYDIPVPQIDLKVQDNPLFEITECQVYYKGYCDKCINPN